MKRETRDRIRQAVAEIAAPFTYRRDRNQIAALLRELADEYQPKRNTWHGRPKGEGIRWTGRQLLIGRTLFEAIGSPRRVSIDITGSTVYITPNADGEYLVSGGTYSKIASITCLRAWQVGQWAEGWRPGHIAGRAICFDIEATEP